ncbi:MAG TPA: acetolactate synthase small subunit [Ktedonobacteraceae bacterium]|nr:acetolactate synthase small subunit [Ktedonobacteraceae bacterium]
MSEQADNRKAAPSTSERAGQADAPKGSGRSHTLVVLANNETGMVDRIVGALRRRRAQAQTISVSQSEMPDVLRITIVMNDSEVGVEQLVEQLRKIVDIRHIVNLSSGQSVARELALVKVNAAAETRTEVIEVGHLFGAHVVDLAQETITLEVTGSEEKIEKLVSLLQRFGVREIARTGSVAMTRDI